jgi:hypothetical protein
MRRTKKLCLLISLVCVGCGSEPENDDLPGLDDLPVTIPSEADWLEVGTVLEAGREGAWDHHLAGASTPSTIIEHEGQWWLYYGGADGLRDDDGGPRHRAIGLATSRDGVRFEKFGSEPVLSHQPTGLEEEGANSAAVSLADDGSFVMHYGAATQFLPDQIHADARVSRSPDGRRFRDVGIALSYQDTSVYGHGDEVFPVASYRYRDSWYVFYLPNGSPQSRDLAVAWGPQATRLDASTLVLDGSRDDPARCGANVVVLGEHVIVFVQRGWKPEIRAEVRVARADAPWRLSRPLRVWDGPLFRNETKFFTVTLDRRRATWLLYRLDWKRRFVLHAAPAGARDESPPSAPSLLRSARVDGELRLEWDDAHDPESGIGQYRIRCGDAEVVESIPRAWQGRTNATSCSVSAVNLHGLEGPGATIQAPLEALPQAPGEGGST